METRSHTEGLPARRAALQILEAVAHGQPFDIARDSAVLHLEERDRRLAHELAAGVLRGQRALDQAIAPCLPRGWAAVPAPVRPVLRLGAYQLAEAFRVPPHAAVSTSVELAREVAGQRASGFVNAVLRRLGKAVLPDATRVGTDSKSLARRHSHPTWLVERWIDRFGVSETRRLLQWNNRIPSVVVQPARVELAELHDRWKREGMPADAAPHSAGLLLPHRKPKTMSGFFEGDFIVQDSAQAMVARYADFPDSSTIYDACAAPGGKAINLGRAARLVLAADVSPQRARRLAQNIERAGSGREHVVVADAARPPIRRIDAVLLDAPCLGTGTLARHPDARWKTSRKALGRLAERQKELLCAVAPVVADGGLLVYATCSLEPEENSLQVDRFLADHPDFRLESSAAMPDKLLTPRGELEILPQRHGMDGAFAARFRKIPG